MDYEFLRKSEKLPFIEKIWLYGSRARGDFKDRSDIDIVIECPDASDSDWYEVEDIIEDADTLLKIDCVRWDEVTEGSLFQQHVFNDRKLLFQRDNFEANWIASALSEPRNDGSSSCLPSSRHCEELCSEAIQKQNYENLGKALERLKEAI